MTEEQARRPAQHLTNSQSTPQPTMIERATWATMTLIAVMMCVTWAFTGQWHLAPFWLMATIFTASIGAQLYSRYRTKRNAPAPEPEPTTNLVDLYPGAPEWVLDLQARVQADYDAWQLEKADDAARRNGLGVYARTNKTTTRTAKTLKRTVTH